MWFIDTLKIIDLSVVISLIENELITFMEMEKHRCLQNEFSLSSNLLLLYPIHKKKHCNTCTQKYSTVTVEHSV